MLVNEKISPRALSAEEKENRNNGVYDSFANYLVFCPKCKRPIKTNMYLQSAEAYIEMLVEQDKPCPVCGECRWILGYPMGSKTGFVKF